ncbi:MAG: hypothetical protein Q9163_003756, partial [Psora crenata]
EPLDQLYLHALSMILTHPIRVVPHQVTIGAARMTHPVIEAAKWLQGRGIAIVEYGQQLQQRYGNPVILNTIEWAVPDEQLSLASQTLLDHGFPLTSTTELLRLTYGDWETIGPIHNVRGVCFSRHVKMRVRLYPLSYVGLTLEDTTEVLSVFDLTQMVLVPKPPNYLISLIRYLINCPRGHTNTVRVITDLLDFLTYYIFQEEPPMNEDVDNESEEDFQKRVAQAVLTVRKWDWDSSQQKYLGIIESIIRDKWSYLHAI